jgi:ribonuclease HI
MTTSSDFIAYIPQEQRELLELSYAIYGDGSCETATGDGGYCCIVLDNKRNRTVFRRGVKKTTNNRMEMTALIEGLKFVCSKLTPTTREYAIITLNSDSTYCTNTLREWIYKWVKVSDTFEGRPNADLLREVYPYLLDLGTKLEICWQPRNSCEPLAQCDAMANEEREKIRV